MEKRNSLVVAIENILHLVHDVEKSQIYYKNDEELCDLIERDLVVSIETKLHSLLTKTTHNKKNKQIKILQASIHLIMEACIGALDRVKIMKEEQNCELIIDSCFSYSVMALLNACVDLCRIWKMNHKSVFNMDNLLSHIFPFLNVSNPAMKSSKQLDVHGLAIGLAAKLALIDPIEIAQNKNLLNEMILAVDPFKDKINTQLFISNVKMQELLIDCLCVQRDALTFWHTIILACVYQRDQIGSRKNKYEIILSTDTTYENIEVTQQTKRTKKGILLISQWTTIFIWHLRLATISALELMDFSLKSSNQQGNIAQIFEESTQIIHLIRDCVEHLSSLHHDQIQYALIPFFNFKDLIIDYKSRIEHKSSAAAYLLFCASAFLTMDNKPNDEGFLVLYAKDKTKKSNSCHSLNAQNSDQINNTCPLYWSDFLSVTEDVFQIELDQKVNQGAEEEVEVNMLEYAAILALNSFFSRFICSKKFNGSLTFQVNSILSIQLSWLTKLFSTKLEKNDAKWLQQRLLTNCCFHFLSGFEMIIDYIFAKRTSQRIHNTTEKSTSKLMYKLFSLLSLLLDNFDAVSSNLQEKIVGVFNSAMEFNEKELFIHENSYTWNKIPEFCLRIVRDAVSNKASIYESSIHFSGANLLNHFFKLLFYKTNNLNDDIGNEWRNKQRKLILGMWEVIKSFEDSENNGNKKTSQIVCVSHIVVILHFAMENIISLLSNESKDALTPDHMNQLPDQVRKLGNCKFPLKGEANYNRNRIGDKRAWEACEMLISQIK